MAPSTSIGAGGVTYPDASVQAAAESVSKARKTSDQTINDSVALTNVTELLFAVGANEVWSFLAFLKWSSGGGTPGIKFSFAVPAAGAIVSHSQGDIAALAGVNSALIGTDPHVFETNGQPRYALIWGLYVGGANAGNVQLQFAQNAATAEDTKILTNSHIFARKVS